MKIAINRCYGGFSVSEAVFKELGWKWDGYGYPSNNDFGIEQGQYEAYRAHPALIAAIEKVGVKAASGFSAELKIVEVPDGTNWEINEYDGLETVRQRSQEWN